MNLADVFIFLFVILGFVIVFVAYWLLAAGLFPRFVERSAERFGTQPVKATLLGAVVAAPIVFLGLALSGKAPNAGLKLAGIVLALLPLLFALFGSAGLAMRIGQGLRSGRDEAEPWRRTLRGAIVLALSFVLPVIGWFGVMPLTFIAGFGVFLLSLFGRKRLAVPAPEFAPVGVADSTP